MGSRLSLSTRIYIFVAAAVASAAGAALAQVASAPALPLDAPPDPMVLVQQLLHLIKDWKSAGLLSSLLGLTYLLTNLVKLEPVRNFLKLKSWMMPAVSCFLGFTAAFITALTSNASVLGALVAGILAGLGATGVHEFVGMFSAAKKAEAAAGKVIADAVVKGNPDAAIKVEMAMTQLNDASELPNKKDRAKALNEWATAATPPADK